MVPQFEEAAYSLKPGEISEPFATAYGYHIVQTLDYKPLPTLDEARAVIDASMRRDGRAVLLTKSISPISARSVASRPRPPCLTRLMP